MSKVIQNGVETDARFHRVKVTSGEGIAVTAGEKPTAVWLPSGCEAVILLTTEAVLDISEVVDHEDIVSMDEKLREMKRAERQSGLEARRARRRLRRGERPVDGDTPKGDDDGHGNRNRP